MKPNTLIAIAIVLMLSLSMFAFAQSTTQQSAPSASASQSTDHSDMKGMDCPCHKKSADKDAKATAEAKNDMKDCCADGKCKMGGECCKGEKGKMSCCGGDKEAKTGKGDCCGGKCDRKAHQKKAA